jgi:hypothetical protein
VLFKIYFATKTVDMAEEDETPGETEVKSNYFHQHLAAFS